MARPPITPSRAGVKRLPGAIFPSCWLPYRLRSAPLTSFRELLPIPTGSLFTPRLWKVRLEAWPCVACS